MGFLDNSTNNIILDAVLTDYGRQALAKNDGSFKISKFALGDDEIDYGIITKYGRTVGREKIEKNTPIFEAFTNQSLSLKYKLISIPRPILYMPNVTLTSPTSITLSASNSNSYKQYQDIIITQEAAAGETTIDSDLLETYYDVHIPNLFLTIDATAAIGSADINNIALYTISASSAKLAFKIKVRSITESTFNVYGHLVSVGGSTTRVINTSFKAVGKNSGVVLDVPVTIYK